MEYKIPLMPGCYYHVFNRGNNGQNIFAEPRNYDFFLRQYLKYITPVSETYAYCLLRNHFHLLISIRSDEGQKPERVLQAFTNFFNSYAKAFNKTYQQTGSLFQKGFQRIPVTSDQQFLALVDYIHRNPQKHGFTVDYRSYPYSSYKALISSRPTHLERDKVLEWFGGRDGLVEFHASIDAWKQISGLVPDDDLN